MTSLTEHCKYIIHCCGNRVLESYLTSINQTTVSGPSNQPKNNPCVSTWGNNILMSAKHNYYNICICIKICTYIIRNIKLCYSLCSFVTCSDKLSVVKLLIPNIASLDGRINVLPPCSFSSPSI